MARFSSAECRSLCQSPANTTLNTVLLLAISCSYIPQIHRIATKSSTWGIAPNYILFNTLFTASQLTLILYLSGYGFPALECIGSNKLKGLDAYGAVLGLIQMSVLWLGSLSLLITFVLYYNSQVQSVGSPPKDFSIRSLSQSPYSSEPNLAKGMSLICISHALIWLMPAFFITLPRPSPTGWHLVPFLGLSDLILIPTSLILVISQFSSQLRMMRAMRQQLTESSLSIWTLATQMILLFLLGISYIVRLGKPGTGFNKPPNVLMDPYTWYRLVGWPYVNNIIYGIGQGVLFFMYLYYLHVDRIEAVISASNTGAERTHERVPLLGEVGV